MTENQIAAQIVDAAYRVHVILGPGLLESVYLRGTNWARNWWKSWIPVYRSSPSVSESI